MSHHHPQNTVSRSLPAQHLRPPLKQELLWLLPLPQKPLVLLQPKPYQCLPLLTLLLMCPVKLKKRKLKTDLSSALASRNKELSDCHELGDKAA